MMYSAQEICQILTDLADPKVAEASIRFFKVGVGEYAEGDRFLGIRTPVLRAQAKQFSQTSLQEVQILLESPFHEIRLCALFILVRQYQSGLDRQQKIYHFYLNNVPHINNWDLVDSSAYKIVGPYLENRDRKPLYQLVQSSNLWERRIAIIATFHFIRIDQFEDTIALSEWLLDDREDLIHKAVGWMLREVGKRDKETEEAFLRKHYQQMPRTMLRYAIEKFTPDERQKYLRGEY